jgi:hypothetical protein
LENGEIACTQLPQVVAATPFKNVRLENDCISFISFLFPT